MNELQIFSKDIIPVYTTNTGEKVVIGRELHEQLQIDTPYNKWFPRMCEYGFLSKRDFCEVSDKNVQNPQGGRLSTNHILKLDMAKHIAMIQRTPQGKAIRQKLIELEERVSSGRLPDNERLSIQKQRAEAMLLNAKTRAYRAIMDSIKDKGLSAVAVEVYGLTAIEGITGKRLGYRPEVEKTYSATDLAKEFGVSANKVGRIATANGLKTEEYGITVMDKSAHSAKEVPNFRYNEAGKSRIGELLNGGGDNA